LIIEATQCEEVALSGLVSDDVCVEHAARLAREAEGEWFLWKAGRDHLPLIRSIHAIGLSKPHGVQTTWWPLVDAAARWADIAGKLELAGSDAAKPVAHRFDTPQGEEIRRHTRDPWARAHLHGITLTRQPGSVRRLPR
jgi:hypothetical protein